MPLAPLTEKFDQGVRLKKRKKSGKWYLCTPPPRGKVEDVRLAVTVFLGLPPTAEVTHEQAREAARRMAGERARGITITVAQTKITVAEVIALYQKELERVEHRSAKTINVALRWVDKRIGGWRLLQLTTLELFQLASEWQREPAPRSRQKNKRLASSTVGFRCGWLCRALKHAEKLGVIGKHQIPTMPTFPRRPVRQGFLEPEEFFGRLGAEATGVLAQYQSRTLFPQEKGKRHYADATEWAYGCGWRSKEIRALEWAWVMANEIKLPAWICKNNEARTVRADRGSRAHHRAPAPVPGLCGPGGRHAPIQVRLPPGQRAAAANEVPAHVLSQGGQGRARRARRGQALLLSRSPAVRGEKPDPVRRGPEDRHVNQRAPRRADVRQLQHPER